MNARALAVELKKFDYNLFTGGTDNHLMLIDFSKNGLDASEAEKRLEQIGILSYGDSIMDYC